MLFVPCAALFSHRPGFADEANFAESIGISGPPTCEFTGLLNIPAFSLAFVRKSGPISGQIA
jgi:hypothetical protein